MALVDKCVILSLHSSSLEVTSAEDSVSRVSQFDSGHSKALSSTTTSSSSKRWRSPEQRKTIIWSRSLLPGGLLAFVGISASCVHVESERWQRGLLLAACVSNALSMTQFNKNCLVLEDKKGLNYTHPVINFAAEFVWSLRWTSASMSALQWVPGLLVSVTAYWPPYPQDGNPGPPS